MSDLTSLKPSREDLTEALQAVGLAEGDVVYVASSLAALGLMDDPVTNVLDALQAVVGDTGTLVMPTFNFSFCRGEPFDIQKTPSTCGRLTEAFRRRPDTLRTKAPPYHSVAAVGPRADEISRLESPTSFGPCSVFQYLHDIGAKHLLIGCGYNEGVAHMHWLEEQFGVPYRFWKDFEGTVVDEGRCHHRCFSMYARDLERGAELDAEPLGRLFEAAGHVRTATVGLCRIRCFSLDDLRAFAEPLFYDDPLILLTPQSRQRFESLAMITDLVPGGGC